MRLKEFEADKIPINVLIQTNKEFIIIHSVWICPKNICHATI